MLRLLARGCTNREIGQILFMSPKTASVHVSRLMAKLGVRNRVQAAGVAHRLQLATADPTTEAPNERTAAETEQVDPLPVLGRTARSAAAGKLAPIRSPLDAAVVRCPQTGPSQCLLLPRCFSGLARGLAAVASAHRAHGFGDVADLAVGVLGRPRQDLERFLWTASVGGDQHALRLLDDVRDAIAWRSCSATASARAAVAAAVAG